MSRLLDTCLTALLKEIKGAVLMPNGWHFKQEGGRPTLAYFVSRENIDKERRYETGFTIQAMRPLSLDRAKN